jgi:hypothetical protein
MREIIREKLRHIQQKAHDQKIWVRSQKAGGKMIPSLDEVADIWETIETITDLLRNE